MLNPYTQAWQNGQSNSNSQNGRPSIFGALPYPTPDGATPTFFSFRFTSFNPNVLNCVILGPQSRPHFRIVTDTPLPGVSVLQNSNGQNVALVQWHRHPEIEIRGVVNRQRTSAALTLSRDQTSRSMTVNRTTMTFVPRQDNFIWIYDGDSQTDILGRISRAQDSIHLELTGEAIHTGLLESAVMAAFLLQCGRNID
ncbi:hypothetical protein FB45DRAFT_1030076 [Roridomyces roridus]|uniref:Uncharacterized protein n=1 Tax=Roridomyces roridus TaxID=1738132 RepID=A0AAD7BN62_9AGAR|nr:hypothetical protein FB45DRAFT_1030076 [Roridomyces roridus]